MLGEWTTVDCKQSPEQQQHLVWRALQAVQTSHMQGAACKAAATTTQVKTSMRGAGTALAQHLCSLLTAATVDMCKLEGNSHTWATTLLHNRRLYSNIYSKQTAPHTGSDSWGVSSCAATQGCHTSRAACVLRQAQASLATIQTARQYVGVVAIHLEPKLGALLQGTAAQVNKPGIALTTQTPGTLVGACTRAHGTSRARETDCVCCPGFAASRSQPDCPHTLCQHARTHTRTSHTLMHWPLTNTAQSLQQSTQKALHLPLCQPPGWTEGSSQHTSCP